jgi:hypothetical protein
MEGQASPKAGRRRVESVGSYFYLSTTALALLCLLAPFASGERISHPDNERIYCDDGAPCELGDDGCGGCGVGGDGQCVVCRCCGDCNAGFYADRESGYCVAVRFPSSHVLFSRDETHGISIQRLRANLAASSSPLSSSLFCSSSLFLARRHIFMK